MHNIFFLVFFCFHLQRFRFVLSDAYPFPGRLVVHRHRDIRLGMARILAPPERCHGLILGPEFQSPIPANQHSRPSKRKEKDSQLSVQRMSAQNGRLVPGPCECGYRDGDGNVDSDLAGFDVAFKVAGCSAVVGEDGGTVSVYAVVTISDEYPEEGRDLHLLRLIRSMASCSVST